jgi:NhaP-type Na+/H+ and K+/H+ antiporter
MKKCAHFFIGFGSALSFSCFAQENNQLSSNKDLAVVSYHVEERINIHLGSNITTYDVPNLNLVSTNDLGPNNSRVITPKYAKPKVVVGTTSKEKSRTIVSTLTNDANPIKVTASTPTVKKDYVTIDVVSTYERVLDNGYKSIDMMKKVADRHFFDDDLTVAAKWYSELFTTTTDLDAVYYYRYAQSLKAINQLEKADQMMKIFESKSL